MRSRLVRAIAAASVLALSFAVVVTAHSGEAGSGISVEPATVTAGGTVVLAGTGLEPDSERQLDLVGPDVVVPFPAVTTDADGMFNVTLTIPGHLPAGTYTLQAIADETLTTDLTVTAAAGQTAAEPKNEAVAVVAARNRSPVEDALIIVVIGLAAMAGVVLVVRAERFGRTT